MKWSKLVSIRFVLLFFVFISIIGGIVIWPEFMIDKVKFPASIVYWSGFEKVRKLFPQPDLDEFSLEEHSLTDSVHYEIQPLDESQIKKMVNQLIPKSLASRNKKGQVIFSSPNKEIIQDFQEHLLKKLPEGWKTSWSISDADAIVTGNLFHLEKEAWSGGALPIEEIIGEEIEEEDKEHRKVLFLFWIMENHSKRKEVLSATSNYRNPKITAATEELAKNLSEINKDLKVALINKGSDSPASMLATASILEEMVNAKIGLTFLNKSDTGKHDTELKQALGRDGKTKVPRHRLAQKFSESTGASAALIIEKRSGGHFYLQLMELSSLNILAIGRSNNRSEEQLQ